MSIEKDVGEMLVFIANNKDMGRGVQMSEKIYQVCQKHGLLDVVENLKDRSKTPLTMWVIDILQDTIKDKQGEG